MNNYAAGDFGNQPDATFPALAIITISGLATKPDAKALALSQPKMMKAKTNNASQHARLRNGGEAAMQ
ncbi:hypothetical protein [Marinobacter sp. MBR-105]|jgi:hypothetical protein